MQKSLYTSREPFNCIASLLFVLMIAYASITHQVALLSCVAAGAACAGHSMALRLLTEHPGLGFSQGLKTACPKHKNHSIRNLRQAKGVSRVISGTQPSRKCTVHVEVSS